MPAIRRALWPSESKLLELQQQVDVLCEQAAQKIAEADVLLLCTGAGFSADSGLAVYADVGRVEAYARRGLTYDDIAQPRWLDEEPGLFWGFAGQCFNDYRDTQPHDGYRIIRSWVDRGLRASEFAIAIQERLEAGGWPTTMKATEPYPVKGRPGAFYAFTSNVDAHHFDWFDASEIMECHGNIEIYQCSAECRGLWRAPLDFRFVVDKAEMVAPEVALAVGESAEKCSLCQGSGMLVDDVCPLCDGVGCFDDDDVDCVPESCVDVAPRVGQVRGGGRQHRLRYMPGKPLDRAGAGFIGNHPKCPRCGEAARPAINMFCDWGWKQCTQQEQRWRAWCAAVEQTMLSRRPRPQRVRAVVLEIGCGNNVPTVRSNSEQLLQQWRSAGADACLVRVNPQLPFGDYPEFRPDGRQGQCVVSIVGSALASIQKIDAAFRW